jgi:1-acyl-sn-glycerol-3-phosphate acyltransferase
METDELEFQKTRPALDRLSSFALLGKKMVAEGTENFIKQGPTIIVGNHIGTFKDAAVIYRIIPRSFIFTANKMILDQGELDFLIRKHLRRHFKEFGLLINALIKPLKVPFINFVTKTAKKIGAVPVDLYTSRRDAILTCQEGVRAGKALITLHGRGRVMKDDPNPYVSPIRKGAAIISYNLYRSEGLEIPVTPLVMFGTHLPLFFPTTIRVNVGKPMYVTDYITESFEETVEKFRAAIEAKINYLFFQIIKSLK